MQRVPFFFEPNFDAYIKPLPAIGRLSEEADIAKIKEEQGIIRDEVVYGNFLMKKVAGNFSTGERYWNCESQVKSIVGDILVQSQDVFCFILLKTQTSKQIWESGLRIAHLILGRLFLRLSRSSFQGSFSNGLVHTLSNKLDLGHLIWYTNLPLT